MNESYLYTNGKSIEKEMKNVNCEGNIFVVPSKKIAKISGYLFNKYNITMSECEDKKFAKLRLELIK